MKINIIGAGTWGIVVASYLADKNHEVTVYHKNNPHWNGSKGPSTNIHPNLPKKKISPNLHYCPYVRNIKDSDLCILAVPTNSLSNVLTDALMSLNISTNKFLILSKGFDLNTGLLPTQLLNQNFNISMDSIAVLSGPNHAEEIIGNKLAATVISSINKQFANNLQNLFSSKTFRVYTSTDIIGVQIGGGVKNVIAIASGICHGLTLGDNTQAALVSRGLNEILELSKVYDFNRKTLYGLSGIGDLVGTCYSKHSRNRQLGVLIGKGKSLNQTKHMIGKVTPMVSEGVNTVKILNTIINDNDLQMPICSEVYNILFNDSDPKESICNLMTRKLTKEG